MSDEAGPTTTTTTTTKASRRRLEKKPARGLLAWSIVAILLSPFAIPTFGIGVALAIGLIVVAAIFQKRGFDARGHLAAGIVALSLGLVSAGACGWLFLRPAEVTGREAVRQDRVESRFDRFFNNATEAPADTTTDGGTKAGDAGVAVDADSPPITSDGGTREPR